ncbi:MAG: universal stress protein [Pirellulaceae bacterium]
MEIAIKRICVPSDFSSASEQAIHYGAAFAKQHGAELHLLHVVHDFGEAVKHPDFTASGEQAREYFNQIRDQIPDNPEVQQHDDAKAKQFLETLEAEAHKGFDDVKSPPWWEEIRVKRTLRYGNPVDEICRYVTLQEIDLLVMGTHGRTGLKHLLLGSVAERVVRISPCPVLTVRETKHAH